MTAKELADDVLDKENQRREKNAAEAEEAARILREQEEREAREAEEALNSMVLDKDGEEKNWVTEGEEEPDD
ncbi:hypothetical protein LH384_34880, partial [Pseudomonas aeruginosa]|nr:hypothetical protein [Pseudomonas aeruginosa]